MREDLKILLLAGTQEARQLAKRLPQAFPAASLVASFAGAVTQLPELSVPIRIGGFGGVEGLAEYCRSNRINAIVDATHPFAVQMSRNAVSAARLLDIPVLRLERPPWRPQEGDNWRIVPDLQDAADQLPAGSRPFIAVGRKEIGRFCHRDDVAALVRMIEPPADALPASWQLVLSRPSPASDVERAFLAAHGATHVVAKNSGGSASYAKIEAARMLRLPVWLADRPSLPRVSAFDNTNALCAALADL